MSEAKKAILKKIQKALENVPDSEKPEDVPVERSYRQKGKRAKNEIVSLFAERIGEYKTTVKRINQSELKAAIDESCREKKVEHLAVADGFPPEWLPDSITPHYDSPETPLSYAELDQADGVITRCALAVAQTGTVILDAGKGQGRRVLTLLPDYHLCIVTEDQIVELVPEGFAHIESSVNNEGRPITFISGPSATSDIELNRVEGVHGPRKLEILIISPVAELPPDN